MLEDIKFDLQTLDFRAVSPAHWADLKLRLERRARIERSAAVREVVHSGSTRLGRLGSRLIWRWWLAVRARQRRLAVAPLAWFNDRMLRNMTLRGRGVATAVHRPRPARAR